MIRPRSSPGPYRVWPWGREQLPLQGTRAAGASPELPSLRGFSSPSPQPPDSCRAPATPALCNNIAQIPDLGSSGVREGSGAPAWLSSRMGVPVSAPSSRLTPFCTPGLPPGFALGLLGSHSWVSPAWQTLTGFVSPPGAKKPPGKWLFDCQESREQISPGTKHPGALQTCPHGRGGPGEVPRCRVRLRARLIGPRVCRRIPGKPRGTQETA